MGSDWEKKVNSWFDSDDNHSLSCEGVEGGSGGKQTERSEGTGSSFNHQSQILLVAPRKSFDPWNYPDLVNSDGQIRLKRARSLFLGDPSELGFSTFEGSLGFGETVFSHWRDQSEYLLLKMEYVGRRKDVESPIWKAMKLSKRGNDVYQRRIKTRLGWLNREIPDKKFFEIRDFQVGKDVKTSLLWVTLTWDRKRSSLIEAWENLGKDFNRFISALRRKYGRISYLRVWESYESGYPHVHVVMLFHDTEFSVFPWSIEKEGKLHLVFRIQEKDDVASFWHSHVDIQAISSLSNVFTYLKKHQEKIILGLSGSIQEGEGDLTGFDLENVKGLRTLFLSWIFRLRSFSVSGDFREKLLDLISHMRNSNMEKLQVDLFGNIVPEWIYHFIGVYAGERLGIPAGIWVKRFSRREIASLLEERG